MGCCGGRGEKLEGEKEEKKPTRSHEDTPPEVPKKVNYPSLAQNSASPGPEPMPEPGSSVKQGIPKSKQGKPDPKPKDFDMEIKILKDRETHATRVSENESGWEVAYDTGVLIVKYSPEPKFSKIVKANYLYIDFEVNASFSTVLDVLENEKIRQSWDQTVKTLEVKPILGTEYETCYLKLSYLAFEREFCERRHRVTSPKEVVISFYSVQDEGHPFSQSFGETYYGMYRIFKTAKNTTAMLLLNKTEYNLNAFLKTVFEGAHASRSKTWLENFKVKVQEMAQPH